LSFDAEDVAHATILHAGQTGFLVSMEEGISLVPGLGIVVVGWAGFHSYMLRVIIVDYLKDVTNKSMALTTVSCFSHKV
jgi:hypothetical protein